jgi:hypothetical protein
MGCIYYPVASSRRVAGTYVLHGIHAGRNSERSEIHYYPMMCGSSFSISATFLSSQLSLLHHYCPTEIPAFLALIFLVSPLSFILLPPFIST